MLTRQNADGRLCTVENAPTQTDPALCIQCVMEAWRITGDERYLAAARRNLEFLKTTPEKAPSGVLYHILGLPELWADTAAMLPASLAAMGEADMALEQMTGLLDALRLENGLYGHRLNVPESRWVRRQPWAAGNGWILAGIAWTIRQLGTDHPGVPQLMALYHDLRKALHPWRLESGLYRDVLDEPGSFEECQTAAMEAVSALTLREIGILGDDEVPDARRTLAVISAHIDDHGAIHDCPGSPEFMTNGTSTEMQAFWLMLYALLRRADAL